MNDKNYLIVRRKIVLERHKRRRRGVCLRLASGRKPSADVRKSLKSKKRNVSVSSRKPKLLDMLPMKHAANRRWKRLRLNVLHRLRLPKRREKRRIVSLRTPSDRLLRFLRTLWPSL